MLRDKKAGITKASASAKGSWLVMNDFVSIVYTVCGSNHRQPDPTKSKKFDAKNNNKVEGVEKDATT
jgi:hypothetical protein